MQNVIKRKIFNDLKKHLVEKEMSLIVGPRQAGKTTLMKQLEDELKQQGEKTLFLNLDFESDNKFFNTQKNLLNKLNLELGNSKGYVFIDEIQRKENAGLFLKGIYDMDLPYKFIISGSGSLELKEKIHESMAGRKRIFELSPVGFEEFVNFKTEYKYENRLYDFFNIEKENIQGLLGEYMNFGGYPKVITSEDKTEKNKIICEILQSYIEKDILLLLKVEKTESFNILLKILADQTGKLINYANLSKDLGISMPTLKKYLWYIEKTFISKRISPFFKNKKKEILKSQLMYFYDLGLRNSLLNIFGQLERPEDFGFVFQNFIFQIILDKIQWKNLSLNFWRTKGKAEVDFVVNSIQNSIPIEIKFADLKNPEIPNGLKMFIADYKPQKAFVANKSFDYQTDLGETKIYFIPFWKIITEDLF